MNEPEQIPITLGENPRCLSDNDLHKLLSTVTSVWLVLDSKHFSIFNLCTSLRNCSSLSFSLTPSQISLVFLISTLFVFSLFPLKRKKENFTADVVVADGRLVSVPPPSSQLDTRDKLWRLHSALLQCRSLLDRAIAKEEEELGDGKKGEYETQRKMVKDRLSLLLINTGELLKAVDGTAVLTPSSEGLEVGADEVDRGVLMMVKVLD